MEVSSTEKLAEMESRGSKTSTKPIKSFGPENLDLNILAWNLWSITFRPQHLNLLLDLNLWICHFGPEYLGLDLYIWAWIFGFRPIHLDLKLYAFPFGPVPLGLTFGLLIWIWAFAPLFSDLDLWNCHLDLNIWTWTSESLKNGFDIRSWTSTRGFE